MDWKHRDTSSPDYKQAFEVYFRTGAAIGLSGQLSADLSMKKVRPTTHYVWRTRQDRKVRSRHAANNGKIFAWDNPPSTGHPGEDYGCRCIAVPYYPPFSESFTFTMSNVTDHGSPWTSLDFVDHYFNGGGQDVRVRDTGHLNAIVGEYNRLVLEDVTRLPTQIAEAARARVNGSFADWFKDSYPMKSIVFSIGQTTIGGTFRGAVKESNGFLQMSGTIDCYLRDEFRDPVDIGAPYEELTGGDRLSDRFTEIPGGAPYDIVDDWGAHFAAEVFLDGSKSRYG